MASEVFSAKENGVNALNAVSQRGGRRDGLLKIMASQMSRARTSAERERIYKAANDEIKGLTGKGISRKEADAALSAQKQKFQGGYDAYLTHLQRTGGFSSTVNKEYDNALMRHEKEGTLTPKERDALISLKYRKKNAGF